MINKNQSDIQAAITGEKDGLIVIPGSIPDLGRRFADDEKNDPAQKFSYEDIASPFGVFAAFKRYLEDPGYQNPVNRNYQDLLWSLYLMISEAHYKGWEIAPVLYETGDDPMGRVYRSYLERINGHDQDPGRILALRINGTVSAVFDADTGVFLPSADFHGITDLNGFITDHRQIVKRTCAYIRLLCDKLRAPARDSFRSIFSGLMDLFTMEELEEEASLLRTEPQNAVPEDVSEYLSRVSPHLNAGLVCGFPGENAENILFEYPCLITVSPDAPAAGNGWRIRNDLEMIPPLLPDCGRPDRLECVSGSFADGAVWADVTVHVNGRTHRRIYSLCGDSCVIANPNVMADMQAGTPAGILDRYTYLEQGSTAAVRYTIIPDVKWSLLPADPSEVFDDLASCQDPNRRWSIHQRRTPATHLVLQDSADNTLGTIFLPDRMPFEPSGNTRHVAFDLGSSRSVRLETVKGTGRFDPAAGFSPGGDLADLSAGSRFIRSITPMADGDLKRIEEFSYDRLWYSSAYIEPLVQRFDIRTSKKDISGTEDLLSRHRIWRPDSDILFKALMHDTGSMNDARTRVGVEAAPKERLSRSDLSEEDLYEARKAFRLYIGTLFMESIYRSAIDGYCFAAGNLCFGVSFPDNGSDTGLTREVKEAVLGAAEYVNRFLAPENRLEEDKNLFLFAENRATNIWHIKNAPKGKFLGKTVAAATSDCGNTTLDFCMSVNGHAYASSIPYAGSQITNASISEAYSSSLQGLVDCFPDITVDLRNRAMMALSAASRASQGRLDKRLGFSMTLGQLFNNSRLSITGPNADQQMHRLQRLICTREYITIPGIADAISRAVLEGDISPDEDIYIAPVGRANQVLDNTPAGFMAGYVSRLKKQLSGILGEDFRGNIRFMDNNDIHKRSVAEGILYMMEGSIPDLVSIPAAGSPADLEGHYLDMVYGEGYSDKKEMARTHLRDLDRPETFAEYREAFDKLYEDAFSSLMNGYTFEDFKKSYNTWALTGRSDNGKADILIRTEVEKDFSNMIAAARETMKYFIMSCPGVEKEHVCGSLLDICLNRIASSL